MRAKVLKFLTHLESGQVYCGTENQDPEVYFYLLFPCLLFSISHSNVIHMEICVKDFWGTTAPRILKFGTNIVVLFKRESACCYLSFSLDVIVHFSFSSIKHFVIEFSAPITARVFKFCIHLERGQVYCGKESQDSMIKFCLLFPSLTLEICFNDFSGTTVPRILKFRTNVWYDFLYCVKENQYAAAYHSLYLSIFSWPEPKAHKVSL